MSSTGGTAITTDYLLFSDASNSGKIERQTFQTIMSTLINSLGEGTSVTNVNDYIITQYVNGGTSNTSFYRRKLTNVLVGRAVADESNNNIKANYAASMSISGKTITLANKNGGTLSTVTIPSIAFSDLPALYWANVSVSSASSTTTNPQFADATVNNLKLYASSAVKATVTYNTTTDAIDFNFA